MQRSQVLALIVGVVAVSWAAPLIRLAHAPAEVIAALRLAIAAPPVLLAALLWRRGELRAFRGGDFVLAVAAGLALACHFLAWVAAVLGVVYPVAAIGLLTAVLVSGQPLLGWPSQAYGYIALLALVPQLIGHTSLNWTLGSLTAVAVAIAVLGEPVGATLIAATLLHEPPTLVQLAGGAIVLAGVAIALAGPGVGAENEAGSL